jgi:phosphatidylinositol dimannoside acyltransferase
VSGIEPHPPAPLRAGLQVATALTRALGPARYPLADSLGMAGYAVSGRRRRNAVRNHLQLDPGIDVREARRRARASFRAFARSGIDFVWACGFGPQQSLSHGAAVGTTLEDTRAARLAGTGGVFALTHFGNWDMAANLAFAIELDLTTVMATTGPRAITDLVIWARRQNRMEVFEADHAALGLVRAIRRGRFVAILSDIPDSGPTVDVPYCGGLVPFSSVPAWLSLRTGAPLFPTACWREDGRYQLQTIEMIRPAPEDDERSLMTRVAATVEPVVRRHPGQWYPFREVYSAR